MQEWRQDVLKKDYEQLDHCYVGSVQVFDDPREILVCLRHNSTIEYRAADTR